MDKKIVAIGPITRLPSWQWIGEDTAKELSKYHKTFLFSKGIPKCDVAIVIKQLPSIEFVKQVKTIYCPIDFFQSLQHLSTAKEILNNCLVLSHSRRLANLIPGSQIIDHHLKFKTDVLSTYKKEGYALWAGGFESTPYLLRYLKNNPVNMKIKILTNYTNESAKEAALKKARELGVALEFGINLEMDLWTEEKQIIALSEAKAAIDIKGKEFSQMHKPPTKVQKYICSGIPTFVNPESESYEYMKSKGLIPPEKPNDYWLSEEYYEKTIKLAAILRNELSLANIGNLLKGVVANLK